LKAPVTGQIAENYSGFDLTLNPSRTHLDIAAQKIVKSQLGMKTLLASKLGKRGAAVRPSFLPMRSAHRRIQQNVRVFALLNKLTTQNTKDSVEEAIVIPLNYAQVRSVA
jgi:hypothetical protein